MPAQDDEVPAGRAGGPGGRRRPGLATRVRAAGRRAPKVVLRPYRRSDDAGLAAVCLATVEGAETVVHPGLPGDVYALPYVRFEPDLCLVVDDGTEEGRVSGYVLGTSDTPAFEQWCERAWWPGVRERYPLGEQERGTVDHALARSAAEPTRRAASLTDRYPAHLHVDLMPHVRGQGLGRRLLEGFMAAASASGARAVHLEVSGSNENARGFYARLGFHLVEPHGDGLVLGRRFD